MSHVLRHERIAVSRTMLIDRAADHCDELLEAIESRLEAAEVAGNHWSMRQVARGGWWARAERWLVVEYRSAPDIRHYIRCREFGAHLEVKHLTAVEPPWWKRLLASAVHCGAWWRGSVPTSGHAEERLCSWLAVVNRAVTAATNHLAQQLARGHVLGRRVEGPLAWW